VLSVFAVSRVLGGGKSVGAIEVAGELAEAVRTRCGTRLFADAQHPNIQEAHRE
jgi:hypothetical protein